MGGGRSAIAIALLLSLPHLAGAQVVRIVGSVKDDAGRPIKGATIVAGNSDHSPSTLTASSDDKGRFGIIGMRRGIWTFTIQAPGFETVQLSREIAAMRPNAPVDVKMQKGAAPPPPPPLAGVRGSDVLLQIEQAESRAAAGDLDAAVAAYEELLTRIPALTTVHLRVGELYERKPDVERALAAYRRLATLEPDNAAARAAITRLTGQH
jgi:hypothetical protein